MKPFTLQPILLAAVASVSLLIVSSARAQFPVDNGRANDVNNRIGSGGYNTGPVPAPETVTGNQIVTGNVTGGKAFRGPVGYSAPNEFSGPSATQDYDRFIRDSTGPQVSYNRTQSNYSNTAVPFYSSVAQPPPGYVSTPNNNGFVPAQGGNYNVTRFNERLGVMTNGAPDTFVPQPGQFIMPGPVDASANQTFISASPLYGVRQFNINDPAAAAILSGNGTIDTNGRATLSDDQILRMRRELAQTLNTSDLNPNGTGIATNPLSPGGTQSLTGAAPTPFEAPENGSLSPQALNNAYTANANDLSTGQGSLDRLVGSPSQQSSQYAEMQRRLQRYNAQQPAKTPEEQNQEFRNQLRAAQQKESEQQSSTPSTGTSGAAQSQTQAQPALQVPDLGKQAQEIAAGKTPSKGVDSETYVHNPSGGVTAVVPSLPAREPVDVHSLAAGVPAAGLHSLLEQAETEMHGGKFDSAIETYESAAKVAPNNPMILLGRANAELGGEYFARAESDLRRSILIDPALLMARYDLRAMMGDKRLDEVINSLKQIASKEADQSRPAILLAYIAYNTNNPDRAASYLDLAEKRAGAPDTVLRLMRSHWNLPAAAPADAKKK